MKMTGECWSSLFDSLHRITDPQSFKENDFYTPQQAMNISKHVEIPSPIVSS